MRDFAAELEERLESFERREGFKRVWRGVKTSGF